MANERDELITEILGVAELIDRGEYDKGTIYLKGHYVFIQKNNLKYYFVSKNDNPTNPPPDKNYWIADSCSRFVKGCKLRWGTKGSVVVSTTSLVKGQLKTSSFPATNKLLQ